jgi:NAD(P)H-dependent FMN reductase
MKVLAFAASSSSKSINRKLVAYATSLLEGAHTEIIDINDYELPLFSEDREAELGQPELAKAFLQKIGDSDAVIISFAEHNGSYTAAYKNIFDWASRINPKVFQHKPMVLLATSPGPGGASNVLAMATASAPYFEGDVKASLSIPSFYNNYDSEQGKINNDEINQQLLAAVKALQEGHSSELKQVS